MFSYREFPPTPPLDRFVRCFWLLKADAIEPGSSTQKILPDGCMEIVIHVGRPLRRIRNNRARRQDTAFLVGQLTECFVLEEAAPAHVLGVRFKPAGTSALLHFDLKEIQNEEVTLESLWGSTGRSLQDAVLNASSDGDRIRILESFLLQRLRGRDIDRRIGAAVRLMEVNPGSLTVAEISERVGWSARQLERQFLRNIGIGPKALLCTLRFQTLLQLAHHGADPDWAALALECGFFDQAHLIREFKRFSGEAPEVFLGQDYSLYEFFALYRAVSVPVPWSGRGKS